MSFPSGALPILPLKNTVLFPGITQTIRVGREKSKRAVDFSKQKNNWILTVTQKDPNKNLENENDLSNYGTMAKIESVKETTDKDYFVVVRGYYRAKIIDYEKNNDFFSAIIERTDDIIDIDKLTENAFLTSLKTMAIEILNLIPGNTQNIAELINGMEDLTLLGYLSATNVDFQIIDKQKILEEINLKNRTLMLLNLLQDLKQNLIIQNDIRNKLNTKLGQTQREHILREQIKTIKEELGGDDDLEPETDIKEKILSAKMPEAAEKLAFQQMKKLSQISMQSPEYQMVRAHLDLMLELPWSQHSDEKDFDLIEAEALLNAEHYGLSKIKKRILQHLSLVKRKKNKSGSILLFLGPPGVGKTSLAHSIAKTLGKKYVRMSLGGIRDESEIRGHRRTYIGALPGKIISALSKVKQNDTLILLDEIDKLSRSYSGDPSAALLEVLDPEQNNTFTDHYLDTPFDLSNVFFIATANSLEGIPLPLLDRLEVIELTGYTSAEKFNIAKNHIIPKALEDNSFTKEELQINDEALLRIITHYTRESGVRDLQRKITEICRYASEKAQREAISFMVDLASLEDIFGSEKYTNDMTEFQSMPGIATGLAWTPVGGEILFIETALVPGRGDLIITGQLGEIMKESAQIAKSLIKARLLKLAPTMDLNKYDIHLHVPSGAIPKDGPSAGITILTSLASLVCRTAVNPKLAMTGEISLRGKVLPVGGIKEKIIAAHRAGVNEVILSDKNKNDLKEVPEEIKSEIRFHFVNHINEVLNIALQIDLKDWSEDTLLSGLLTSPNTGLKKSEINFPD